MSDITENNVATTSENDSTLPIVVGTCAECGKALLAEEPHFCIHDGDIICEECRAYYDKCHDCGEFFSTSELTECADDVNRCDECLDSWEQKHFVGNCDICGSSIYDCDDYADDGYDGDHSNLLICYDCLENSSRVHVCDECGCHIISNHYYATHDGKYVCDECYDNYYFTCNCCGAVLREDERYEDNGFNHCQSCHDDWEEEHSSSSVIEDYGHTRCVTFYHLDKDGEFSSHPKTDKNFEKALHLGFELESGGIDSRSDCNNIAEYIHEHYSDDGEMFVLKEDSSIPDYGFEMVSMPMTLEAHKVFKWKSVVDYMSSHGLRSHDLGKEACGLHVHVDRYFMSPERWVIADWLMFQLQPYFETVARRKSCQWASFSHRSITGPGDLKKGFGGEKYDGRYVALNFENRNTVEFRCFRGTLKFSTLMATLEFVDAFVKWAKDVSCHDILNVSLDEGKKKKSLSDIRLGIWQKFLEWVKKPENIVRYQDYLKPYLEQKSIWYL